MGKARGGERVAKKRGRRPTVEITEHQRSALEALRDHIAHRGFPPTVKELAKELGTAPSSTHDILRQLERKGYIRRDGRKARSVEILREPEEEVGELVPVPIVGTVAGGIPILAEENRVGELLVDARLVKGVRCFALRVRGDSMSGVGIASGDYVVARQQAVAENGDIVVALLGDEATVKRLHISDAQIELRPENPRHRAIVVTPDDELRIQGKVIAVRRRMS